MTHQRTIYNKTSNHATSNPTSVVYMSNGDKNQLLLRQSRISDISEAKLKVFPGFDRLFPIRKAFLLVKLTVLGYSQVYRWKLLYATFRPAGLASCMTTILRLPDVRQIAECLLKSGVEKGKTLMEGGQVHSPLKKDPLINHEHQFWTYMRKKFPMC